MSNEELFSIFKDKGFCGHCLHSDVYESKASCAYKDGRFEFHDDDPECKMDSCPFIKLVKNNSKKIEEENDKEN